MGLKIVTDSAADLPDEIQKKFEIHVIPTPVIIDGADYFDGETILAKDFYEILFCDNNGKQERKTFKREVYSKKAKLLYNDIESSIEEMGQSITPQEKRQVLMDLLEKLL